MLQIESGRFSDSVVAAKQQQQQQSRGACGFRRGNASFECLVDGEARGGRDSGADGDGDEQWHVDVAGPADVRGTGSVVAALVVAGGEPLYAYG